MSALKFPLTFPFPRIYLHLGDSFLRRGKQRMAGIFKSYDIRGTVPNELTTGDAYRIGKAAVGFFKAKTLGVGRDARIQSPDMSAALIAGINAAGADCIDLGMNPTPMTYYATGVLGKQLEGAIQVTASHNPSQYNGFKFTRSGALPMSYDTGLNEVEALYKQDKPGIGKSRGKTSVKNMRPGYIKHCRNFANLARPLKIAIDTGNGVMGDILPDILKSLPLKVVPLFFKPDGRFPNHEANPLKAENLVDLQKAVVEKKCDIGVAFDGDGDRVAFVDENGVAVPGDLAGALMAQVLLAKNPGAKVFYDVRATKALPEAIAVAGGVPLETRVGHSYIKAGMRKDKAVMAAELSGHYYFRDFFYSDSGETAFFLVLSLLSQGTKKASELVTPLQRYFHTSEINFEVHDAGKVLAAAEAKYGPGAKKVSKVDGISIDMGSWWFNLRMSNTEPVVRLNLESLKSKEEMEEKKAEVSKLIAG
ncbi:MAG TPA: phosphomannomutase/phosphoglucomutase [Planctomycetota bacterium]|nr:phosphomannomutase/phosphoglucomutase [Planctomycetota bacterium]